MQKGKANQPKPYYSAVLKRQVLREYASGLYTKAALCVKYGILGSNTLLEWQRKSITLEVTSQASSKTSEMKRKGKKEIIASLSQPQSARSTEQDRISELEKQLAESRLREQLYLRIISLSSEEYGEDLLKKTGIG